jgi:hypothetical protein
MKIGLFFLFQMLACLIVSLIMVTSDASAAVTIDFDYGIQDSADCTNGVRLKLQIDLGGKVEEIFAGEAKKAGEWVGPQSVEIPSKYVGKDFILIWVIDPLDGNIGCDWFVIKDPWVMANGAKKYSFFDKYKDAEYTTADPNGKVVSHGFGQEGNDAMWNDAGALFVQLPWSQAHGVAAIPDAVGKVPCVRTIFSHPPQKGLTNGGTVGVRFKLGSAQISVESKEKLEATWGKLKYM